MTHISPTVYGVWSVLVCALSAFLLGHLWSFDRFKCLKWSNAPHSGAFKRIMTYTYLITIPFIMVYAFGFTYMKYKVGYTIIPGGQIFPKPYFLWPQAYQRAIFPLVLVFSVGWSFEMVTHLEELCFWLFLVNAGPQQPDWFRSPYFRTWMVGSIIALLYLPLVTILTRHNPLTCEAHMFLAGSIGDTVLTFAFIPILWAFPAFLQRVKKEGVDLAIMVRLRKFYELNVVRVIFRLLFSLPLIVIGSDGVKAHDHHINESLFWTDILVIIAALGCIFQSVITLLIFFPRSYEAEYQAYEASVNNSGRSSQPQPSNPDAHSARGQPNKLKDYVRTRVRLPFVRRHTTGLSRAASRAALTKRERDVDKGYADTDTEPHKRGRSTTLDSEPSKAHALSASASVVTFSGKDTSTYLLTNSPVIHAQTLSPDATTLRHLPSLTHDAGYGRSGLSRELLNDGDDEDVNGATQWVVPRTPYATQAYYLSSGGDDEDSDPWQGSGAKRRSADIVEISTGGVDPVTGLPEMTYVSRQTREHERDFPLIPNRRQEVTLPPSSTTPAMTTEGSAGLGNGGALGFGSVAVRDDDRDNGRHLQLNPLIHNFRSPIDLLEGAEPAIRPRRLPQPPTSGWV